MSESTPKKLPETIYKCQFCEEETPAKDWKDDKCPKCGCKYDPILAQEMDD